MNKTHFHAGELVEVRSKEEILQTLDPKGELEGLPFMPQMFQYCGQQLRVFKRAHKTCDTVNDFTGRRMNSAVHLTGIRCDGQAYGGCQAACLIFWKEAWLKSPVKTNSSDVASPDSVPTELSHAAAVCREEDVWSGTRRDGGGAVGDPIYKCQATQVPAATEPLLWWDIWQYIEDFTSGNAGVRRMVDGLFYMGFRNLMFFTWRIGLSRPLPRLYDAFQSLRGGVPYPRRFGKIPVGTKTPSRNLNLQPGEWVRVKTYPEILATLDSNNKNRGLIFDAEMVPYCGRSFRVLQRVTKILNEKTGKMMEFKNDCIMLEGVVCESRYSECRMFCPRSIYSYWREAWLERVADGDRVQENGASANGVGLLRKETKLEQP